MRRYRALAVYLGPIAKVVAKKAAQQAESEDEFVQIVASYIGTQDRNGIPARNGAAIKVSRVFW